MPIINEKVEFIKNEIINKFKPKDIILFGSYAKGLITQKSDIDICVIMNTDNKRKLVQDIMLELDCDYDIDIVVYTEDEWDKYKEDKATFAHIIASKGVSLIG